jgi:hypothetical protein
MVVAAYELFRGAVKSLLFYFKTYSDPDTVGVFCLPDRLLHRLYEENSD